MKSNYEQTVDWLYSKLPMFQRTGASAYKKDLGNISALMQHLGNPHKDFKSIHIAGTNGKGSSSHLFASVLQEAGYKTGLTTSPHLKDFRERIRVNGKICPEEFIIQFVEKNAEFIETLKASFFEVAVAMAFTYFSKEKVDIAVIETGLGGRLDSTNIIHPQLSVITNIGLDHTSILGETLEEIAQEKAGIIKSHVPVIIGEAHSSLREIFIQKARENHAEIGFVEEMELPDFPSDLQGIYQKKNKRTVLAGLEVLKKLGYTLSEESIQKGFLNTVKNTGLRGRWEKLGEKPTIIADTAHNPHGLAQIQKQLAQTPYHQLHLVLGFLNDKDVSSILAYFPSDAHFYFSEPNVPRKLPVEDLRKLIPTSFKARYFDNINLALEAAIEKAGKEDLVYIGGSTFTVAEILD